MVADVCPASVINEAQNAAALLNAFANDVRQPDVRIDLGGSCPTT